MARQQVEERKIFTFQEKKDILAKTDGKCAHCGLGLTPTHKKFTIEHMIPISKGGTNEMVNLLPLCEECNKSKGNMFIHPADYYKYIKEEYQEETVKHYHYFCQDISWFSRHNFTRDDSIGFFFEKEGLNLKGHSKKSNKRNVSMVRSMEQKAFLTKINNDDKPAIVEFVCKYNKKMDLQCDEAYIKDVIEETIKNGAIYKLHQGSTIIALIPIGINKMQFGDKEYYAIFFNGLPCYYQKPYYMRLIKDAFEYILVNLSYLNDIKAVTWQMQFPKKDRFILETLISLGMIDRSAEDDSGDDLWYALEGCVNFLDRNSGLKTPEEIDQINNYSIEKKAKIISDAMQRRLDLREIKENKDTKTKSEILAEKKKQNKKHKKELKRYNDVDEYDERYYL